MTNIRIHGHKPGSAIVTLERLLETGRTTIVRAAFEHSYFAHPDRVREKTPYFPKRARYSRAHYPDRGKNELTTWQGQPVKLDDNSAAQRAWKAYSGLPLFRGSGYGVRHIWGHPWDPNAFTAGWNLCYMPFWVGMLTEHQHRHAELEQAVRQAAWNLYFSENRVCKPPNFVTNPGIDLDAVLDEQPLLIMAA